VDSDFKRVIENSRMLLKLKYSRNLSLPLIEIQFMRMHDDKNNINEFREFWHPLLSGNDKIHVQRFTTFANRISGKEGCFEINDSRLHLKKILPCRRMWRDISVYYNGNVSACCYDVDGELIIGNVHHNTLKGIWNGKVLKDLRNAQLRREFSHMPICSRCIGA